MSLKTKSGHDIPEFQLDFRMLMGRSITLYGPSGTGKTVVAKAIMKVLDPHIEQIIVVSPTERSNNSYQGFVRKACIHYSPTIADPADKKDTKQKQILRFFQEIYERQQALTNMYKRANRIDILQKLYGYLSHAARKEGDRLVTSIARKSKRAMENIRKQYLGDEGRRKQKEDQAKEIFEQMIRLVYKKFIYQNYQEIWDKKGAQFTADEHYAITYFQLNPNLLLILDDCAAELKQLFTKDIFRKIYYQGRHDFITLLLLCQDDTDLPTNLRKNSFISIFTDPVVCSSNFERTSNGFAKQIKQQVPEMIAEIFAVRHRKMVYIREDPKGHHFYHLTCANPAPFLFGSDAINELCDAIEGDGTDTSKNKYFDRLKV